MLHTHAYESTRVGRVLFPICTGGHTDLFLCFGIGSGPGGGKVGDETRVDLGRVLGHVAIIIIFEHDILVGDSSGQSMGKHLRRGPARESGRERRLKPRC